MEARKTTNESSRLVGGGGGQMEAKKSDFICQYGIIEMDITLLTLSRPRVVPPNIKHRETVGWNMICWEATLASRHTRQSKVHVAKIKFDCIVVDYLPTRKFSVIGQIAKWGLRTATVATLVGIYQF